MQSNDAAHAVHAEKIDSLEKSRDVMWEAMEKEKERVWGAVKEIRDNLANISIQLAAFGVVNTLIMGYIAYRITKGL